MKKILLVDDDQFVLRVFRDGLARQGYQVETAQDGLEAVKRLQENRPDIVVLDLMMPKFTGVDVVKFIRGRPDLADLPVIVLSNSYIDELANAVREAGVQEALVKSRCTPGALVEVIEHTLNPNLNRSLASDTSILASHRIEDFQAKARQDFLAHAGQTSRALRALFEALKTANNDFERGLRLEALYRKLHFVSATAGVAGCPRVELLTSVFEALVFVLMDKPANLTPSLWRTISRTMDFLEKLIQEPGGSAESTLAEAMVLVVDDDAVINRLIVSTLHRVQLKAKAFQNPIEAFGTLGTSRPDLILLDVEMPGLDGFEFCRRARTLPGFAQTPIVYVTSHTDFNTKTEGLFSGGTDLIAKPFFPMELAVKVVIHLLNKNSAA